MAKRELYGSIIITYRCNAKCNMCDCFKNPSKKEDELTIETIKKLPEMAFTNVTGGEPFIRKDIGDIIEELYKKTDRIVISTNGFFGDRIIDLCEKYPELGIRISLEGLEETNDAIRGIPDGFKRGFGTLERLVDMGHKDVGFGMTCQEMNAKDLTKLYQISDDMAMEFATATLHNSFYFRKIDNKIDNKVKVAKAFEELINMLLKSKSPKKWFRAYFNHGLINYMYGNDRLLPCEMGTNGFFLDPFGKVLPCNGSTEPMIMGDLSKDDWDTIWSSKEADEVRCQVKNCEKNCWMIGSVAPAMKKRIWIPAIWVVHHKIKGSYSLKENKYLEGEM